MELTVSNSAFHHYVVDFHIFKFQQCLLPKHMCICSFNARIRRDLANTHYPKVSWKGFIYFSEENLLDNIYGYCF